MNTDAMRDELARLEGYSLVQQKHPYSFGKGPRDPASIPMVWQDKAGNQYPVRFHPVDASLDWLSANWPEGWEWCRTNGNSLERLESGEPPQLRWFANRRGDLSLMHEVSVPDTGHEYHDRLALMLAVMEATDAH